MVRYNGLVVEKKSGRRKKLSRRHRPPESQFTNLRLRSMSVNPKFHHQMILSLLSENIQHCKAMESMIELCDLIAQNPSQFADKLAWICGRCPPIDSVLATARFLSKCPNFDDMRP
ncbi:unnamed protein product [Ilex paraguariensis]|uniref:Uncharacterized protein n=1 Tax=Ilex paraguariensis TaxID=185542 RepID=A0ABC8S2R9_9AQUA